MMKYILLMMLVPGIFIACKKENNGNNSRLDDAPDLAFYALTDDNKLLELNASRSAVAISEVDITGMLSGEKILSIDYRPATGQLYALSSTSVLYTLDEKTGKLSIISTTPFEPKIAGGHAAIDFNPTVDRIRLVSPTGQNLRLHPETGVTAATDGNINGVSGASVAAIAYTNSRAGATETALFDIDATTDKLYKQMPPNDGTLVEVGALGIDISGVGGFDIAAKNNIAIAALNSGTDNKLYGVDLATGSLNEYGSLPSNNKVIGIAIPTDPVAYAVDGSNNLHIFNPLDLQNSVSKAVTGLQDMETIVGIDMRPVTGQLFGLGSTGRLYTFNLATGAAAMVGSTPLALSGNDFGFDFNPTVDRIRIVSNTGMNLRVNPNDGMLAAADAMLNPGTPAVTAAAYTNSFPGATSTALFDIDTDTDKLYKQDPPNNGVLIEIGALGLDAVSANGFDIGGKSGKAYAILTSGSSTGLYTLDLMTGNASKISDFPVQVTAMAVGLGF